MPQTADWKTLSIISILLVGIGCPLANEQVAFAATKSTPKVAATSEDEKQCLPHCRSNFVCIKGECVSECNPPCASNESCKLGECVAKAQRVASSSDEQATSSSQRAKTPAADNERFRPEPSMPPPAKVNRRIHDGFYLRMSFGLGALIGNWTPNESSTRNLVGFAEHYELALGGTPIPGLVIGGGIFGVIASSPMYGWSTNGSNINIPGGSIVSEIIGPFVDVYPKPAGGFHFMAALGPAGVSQSSGGAEELRYSLPTPSRQVVGTPATPYSGVGVGFVAGVGYEVYVADHWSIGGILRIMYTYANLSPNDSTFLDAKLSSFTPGLMFGATYQ